MTTFSKKPYQHSIKIKFWHDWVRVIRTPTGASYLTSETPLEGYNHRTIGLAKDNREVYYIAVAVRRETKGKTSSYSGRGLVAKRVRQILTTKEVTPEDTMCTLIPQNYVDLLWLDPDVYANLCGPLNKDVCLDMMHELSE